MKGNSFSYVIQLISLTAVSCEFYSSVQEVLKLADYEQFLLGKMEKFVTLNENKLNYLKEKLAEFEGEREDALAAGEKYFENPINKYLLTKRLSLDWEKLENFLDHEVGTNILRSMDKFAATNKLPNEHDFKGALEAMLRLQKIYRLDSKDMAKGILRGVKYYSEELSARDCFDLGISALKDYNYLAANAWLTEALERFDSYWPSVGDVRFEKPDILEPLAEAKFYLGDYNGASEMSYALNFWRFNDTRLLEIHNKYIDYAYTTVSAKIESEHEAIPDDLDDVDEFLGYRLTCSEIIHREPSDNRRVRCYYQTKNHPFLTIAPIKVEEIHWDPLILVFHDVMSDLEIEKVIQLAKDKIERASVLTAEGRKVSEVRTCQHTFLESDADPVLAILDQRVADMTGLNMTSAERPQVANYGIGGHYAQHFDFFPQLYDDLSERQLGNRMATVLFYMSDVEEGGGTTFQYVKALVKPKKGSAVFWYNLHASGDGDSWTKHGACPVLIGSKWILNRWIRERGQEFTRPCGLVSDALDTSVMF